MTANYPPEGVPKVLIVEDDESVREVLTAHLVRKGYRVTAVESVEEALSAWGKEVLDFALVDYSLHPINGLELIERLLVTNTSARMILMSGRVDIEIPPRLAGLVLFLPKPFRRAELVEVFRAIK